MWVESERGQSSAKKQKRDPRGTHVGNTKGTWEAGYLPHLWKMTPILDVSRNLVIFFSNHWINAFLFFY